MAYNGKPNSLIDHLLVIYLRFIILLIATQQIGFTHTDIQKQHTHIYIYIYSYICLAFMLSRFSFFRMLFMTNVMTNCLALKYFMIVPNQIGSPGAKANMKEAADSQSKPTMSYAAMDA